MLLFWLNHQIQPHDRTSNPGSVSPCKKGQFSQQRSIYNLGLDVGSASSSIKMLSPAPVLTAARPHRELLQTPTGTPFHSIPGLGDRNRLQSSALASRTSLEKARAGAGKHSHFWGIYYALPHSSLPQLLQEGTLSFIVEVRYTGRKAHRCNHFFLCH